jgi:hypothetical protein
VARPLALIAIPALLAAAGCLVIPRAENYDPIVVAKCREEAETAAKPAQRDAKRRYTKDRYTGDEDIYNRCLRRGRPDYRRETRELPPR